ncbi:hypothetical protein BD309DRAFT_879114, partial [Dichomitus squalens]
KQAAKALLQYNSYATHKVLEDILCERMGGKPHRWQMDIAEARGVRHLRMA